ncbi:MAG: hypothetical protein DWG79_01385 [Chloroflexi bacterium]|nr:hypothetical protein [Chloroflexota bacterium]MQC82508.1 hypothetical protein [Chloroflexota bacterium]
MTKQLAARQDGRAKGGKVAIARELGSTIYQVRGVDGELEAEHVRKDVLLEDGTATKKISWRRNGRSGLGGFSTANLPLYGIHDLGTSVARVVVVEGEKAADALRDRGVTAVGTVTGASGTPSDESLTPLLNFEHIILWPDNDQAGGDHMTRVAQSLLRLGAFDICVASWPSAPPKGDAADYEGTSEELKREILGQCEPVTPEKSLPKIQVNLRQLGDVQRDAMAALQASKPELYERAGELVRVRVDERGRPIVSSVGKDALRTSLADAATWLRATRDGSADAFVPLDIASGVLAFASWGLPQLVGITEAPIVRLDGTVLTDGGHDPVSGYYAHLGAGLAGITVASDPGPEDARRAAQFILFELFDDFPFADDASRAHALALLVTAVIRPAIRGSLPIAAINKPQAGTGGSLLIDVISTVATGRRSANEVAPSAEEEWRKVMHAEALEGALIVTFDNVEQIVRSAALASAVTSGRVKGRRLGASEMLESDFTGQVVLTGNNLRFGGDIPRRTYMITLDARVARPFLREGFRHDDLIGWAGEHRREVLEAVLTMCRAWYCAGSPDAGHRLGSFEDWARVVGGIVTFARVEGFLEGLEEMWEDADEDGPAWEAFLRSGYALLGPEPFKTSDLFRYFRSTSDEALTFQELAPAAMVLDGKDESAKRSVGHALASQIDHRYGEDGDQVWLERGPKDRTNVRTWRISIDTGPPGKRPP